MREVLVKERLGVGDSGTSNRGFYKDQAIVAKKLRSPPLTEPWLDSVREEVKKLSMLMHPNLSLFLGIAIKCVESFFSLSSFSVFTDACRTVALTCIPLLSMSLVSLSMDSCATRLLRMVIISLGFFFFFFFSLSLFISP